MEVKRSHSCCIHVVISILFIYDDAWFVCVSLWKTSYSSQSWGFLIRPHTGSLLGMLCVVLRLQPTRWAYSDVVFLSLLQRFSLLPKGLGTYLLTPLKHQLCTSSCSLEVNDFQRQWSRERLTLSCQATEEMFTLFISRSRWCDRKASRERKGVKTWVVLGI